MSYFLKFLKKHYSLVTVIFLSFFMILLIGTVQAEMVILQSSKKPSLQHVLSQKINANSVGLAIAYSPQQSATSYSSTKIKNRAEFIKTYYGKKKLINSKDVQSPLEDYKRQFNNSVGHERQDVIKRKSGPSEPTDVSATSLAMVKSNIKGIRGLSGNELIKYLKASNYDSLRFLWTFDQETPAVFSAQNMITVFQEIDRLAPTYDGTNQQGLYPLLIFAHVGYYHYFYHSDDLDFGTPVLNSMLNAFDALAVNAHLADVNNMAANIAYEFINTIDAAGLGGYYLETYKSFLTTFENDFARRSTNYYHCLNVYSVLFSLQRKESNDYSGIDRQLISLLEYLAVNRDFPPFYEYIVNNAIWTLGRLIGVNKAMNSYIVLALTHALDAQPRLSGPYIWVIAALNDFNKCQTARPGETICRGSITPEIKAMLFPNTFSFDDGAIIIKTPLSLEKAQRLYYALKEVEAQFNRLTETITPLPGDPTRTLTVMLYGSRTEYETYHTFIYNLSTDNGGIYIEQQGTLYTYERLPSESIYTLEELVRHEFSHYLVGRFLIAGFWGEEPIYQNNRTVWFDEGMAEFFTWSGQTKIGVREKLVRQIKNDSSRMHLNEILSSSYDNFIFYRYAALLFNYLYQNRLDILKNLIHYAHQSDVASLDNLIKQMKADSALEADYQQYLVNMVAMMGRLDNPFTNVPDVAEPQSDDIALIQEKLRATRMGYLADCSVAAIKLNGRFSCRGYLSGSLRDAAEPVQEWKDFNSDLNEIIGQLANSDLNNLHYLNCRMGAIRHIEYGAKQYPLADYFCDGPLAGNHQLLPPVEQVTDDFHRTRLGSGAMCRQTNTNLIKCEKSFSSMIYSSSTDNAIIGKTLEENLAELGNQVYATRPTYYRNFYCLFSGPIQKVDYSNNQKYLIRPVKCEITLAGQ